MAIIGLDKLSRKLKAIPKAAERAAKEAVIQGANEIATIQRTLAPVDDGDLKDSIEVTGPNSRTPAYSLPGGSMTTRDMQAVVTAGNTKVRYPHLVEWGTAPHLNGGQFAGSEHPGTKANPFFWPGYRAVRRRVRSRITRVINKAVKDVAQS